MYHVYITTSRQRKLSSIYEYSDNSFVNSIHKEKSHKHWVYGTFHILYYLKNSKLANTLSKHSICNFFEAGNVCTCNIVSFLSITFGSVIDIVVDIYHDAL